MIRFRYPSADALRDALEQLLEQPVATAGDPDTPIPVDVYREGSEIVVEAALPGVRLSDIQLSGEAGLLPSHAQIRILKLPDECDVEAACPSPGDGVLRITLTRPKATVSHAIKVEIEADKPSTIVMGKTPQVVNAVKGKDYRDIETGPRPRRRRS